MTDVPRVHPHLLRRMEDDGSETFGMATIGGVDTLFVAVTEEAAEEARAKEGYADLAPIPVVDVGDIEEACTQTGVASIGVYGLAQDDTIYRASVELAEYLLVETY